MFRRTRKAGSVTTTALENGRRVVKTWQDMAGALAYAQGLTTRGIPCFVTTD